MLFFSQSSLQGIRSKKSTLHEGVQRVPYIFKCLVFIKPTSPMKYPALCSLIASPSLLQQLACERQRECISRAGFYTFFLENLKNPNSNSCLKPSKHHNFSKRSYLLLRETIIWSFFSSSHQKSALRVFYYWKQDPENTIAEKILEASAFHRNMQQTFNTT